MTFVGPVDGEVERVEQGCRKRCSRSSRSLFKPALKPDALLELLGSSGKKDLATGEGADQNRKSSSRTSNNIYNAE